MKKQAKHNHECGALTPIHIQNPDEQSKTADKGDIHRPRALKVINVRSRSIPANIMRKPVVASIVDRSFSNSSNAKLKMLQKIQDREKARDIINDYVADDFTVARPVLQIKNGILKNIQGPTACGDESEERPEEVTRYLSRKRLPRPPNRVCFDVKPHELRPARIIERDVDSEDNDGSASPSSGSSADDTPSERISCMERVEVESK